MLKKIKITFTFLLIFCILALTALVFILKSQTFKNYASHELKALIQDKTAGSIKVEEITYEFPLSLRLKNISTKKLSLTKLEASFSFFKLLKGKFEIDSLNIDSLNIVSTEESQAQESEVISSNCEPFLFSALSYFLRDVKIRKWSVHQLTIEDYNLQLEGVMKKNKVNRNEELKISLFIPKFSTRPIQCSLSLKKVMTALEEQIEGTLSLIHLKGHLETSFIFKKDDTLHLNEINGSLFSLLQYKAPSLKISFFPFLIKGKMSAEMQNFQYGDFKAFGHLKFSTFFSSKNKKQAVKLLINSSKIIKETVTLIKPSLKILIDDLYNENNRMIKSAFFIKKALLKENEKSFSLNQIKLHSVYSSLYLKIPFSLKAEQKNFQSKIELTGHYEMKSKEHSLCVEKAKGEILKEPLNLREPFFLHINNNAFQVSPLELTFGKSRLNAFCKYDQNSISLAAELNQLDVTYIYDQAISGIMNLHLNLFGSLKNPKGSLDITFENLKSADENLTNVLPLDGKCFIEILDHACSFNGFMKDQKHSPLFFDAKIPGNFSFDPFLFSFNPHETLSGNVYFKGDVADVIEILSNDPPHFSGKTDIEVEWMGTLLEPHFKGLCKIEKGTFEIPETGVLYKNIEAKFTSFDSKVTLENLKANDAFEGIINGSGNLLLKREENFPFEMNLQLQDTNFLRLDYATATGSGHVKLKGDLNSADFSGKLSADEAKIEIPDESTATVLNVDVVYRNKKEDLSEAKLFSKTKSWPIFLDLDFETKEPFSIKGKDLKSKWKGLLKIKGTTSSPELFGDFKIIKKEYQSQYKFRGKIFEISEGTITFSGDPAKKTALYVVGSQEIGDTRIDVILKGSLKAPVISFRSNPPLSQREIISYILFGHGAENLNSFEGKELNKSIKNLNKGSSTPDLFTQIRDKIGLDTIDINKSRTGENGESNEVSIKVGKYVSRGILVSVNKSINAEANRLSIEAKLFKNIKVEAEVGDDAEGQLNLKWKIDY